MNDKYFDKKIREILERPPEFEPSPAARRDMRKKLDALAQPGRKPLLPWWWVLFPLGILAGWWWGRHSAPLMQAPITHTRDTIVVEKRLYTHDTIFVYPYARPERHTAAAAPTDPQPWPTSPQRLLAEWLIPQPLAPVRGQAQTISIPPTKGKPSFVLAVPPLSLAARASGTPSHPTAPSPHLGLAPAVATLPLEPIAPHHAHNPLLDDDRIVLPPLATPHVELPLWTHLVPTAASVQVTGGPAYFLQRGFEDLEGWTLRLDGRIHFARGTFLQVGIGQIAQSFKVEDTTVMARFPQIAPEKPDDQLHDIYVDNLSFVEVPIVTGWEGRWGPWRPIVGVGLTLRNTLKQQLRYEFIDAHEEYYIPVSFEGHRFDLHTWSVHLGIGRHLWQGLSATVAARFEKDWRKGVEDVITIQYLAPTLSLRWQW